MLDSPYEKLISRRGMTRILHEIGFLEIEVTVINYLTPVLPRVLINFFEPIAARFARIFDPIACRYLYVAKK